MNFLRNTFADAKLKYRISHLVSDAVVRKNNNNNNNNSSTKKGASSNNTSSSSATNTNNGKGGSTSPPPPGGSNSSINNNAVDSTFIECVKIADVHADQVLHAVKDHLSYSKPDAAYGALKLLEYLVACCNYNFHVVLAKQTSLHEKLLQLAVRRTEDGPHRLVQREARLALLEWSRTFADDADLAPLSQLAAVYEKRTHKSLMRSLNLLTKKVGFAEIQREDYIMISPKENPGSMTQGGTRPKPVSLHAAEVWSCPVCSYLNAPSATKCAGCDTVRLTTDEVTARHAAILASANSQNSSTYNSSGSSTRSPPAATVLSTSTSNNSSTTHADPTNGAAVPSGTVLQGTAVVNDASQQEQQQQQHKEDARANEANDNLLNAVESGAPLMSS